MKGVARKTAISWVEKDEIHLRGYRVTDLLGNISLGAGIYLLLSGELPTEPVGRLFEAILLSILDHGPTPASTLAASTVASAGAPLSSCVAAGVLAISKHHGGAIEDCMKVLQLSVQTNANPDIAAAEIVERHAKADTRIPGFGHRLHHQDPRTVRLIQVAENLSLAGSHVRHARAIEAALTRHRGNPLPLNVDGAIAALLCDIHFPAAAANGIFMIARVPGLIAHALEEQSRNAPLAPIDPDAYEYDGPAPRKLPA